MSEYPKICFDRILPQDLNSPQIDSSDSGPARAIIVIRKLWPNGSNLRIRFIGGTPTQHQIVKDYAPQWTQHANLTFEFNNAPDAEIRISFNSSDGAWSYVGTDCQGIPRDQPTMNLGWQDEGVVLHEFGHAIGLGHEHQNPRGGIQWNRANVVRDLSGPPNFWDVATIENNVLNKYSQHQVNGTQFDPNSIMLYAFPGSWTLSGQGTHENEVLSAQDKAFISSDKAYPGRVADKVELTIDAQPTQANIGQPGEEDIFKFTVAKDGIYAIETGGQTDVMMKLYGPNSQTQLIAQDDDGGVGLNAKIVRPLLAGEYFVQIRHYNQSGGTGAYDIRVSSSTVEIPVNASGGTPASIGQPGEVDTFKFEAVTNGNYTIETGGQTDVMMKLYGPNSQTQLIAEDDDSGVGRNSKIAKSLVAGEYFVKIQHYNKSRGTGTYTIKVSAN